MDFVGGSTLYIWISTVQFILCRFRRVAQRLAAPLPILHGGYGSRGGPCTQTRTHTRTTRTRKPGGFPVMRAKDQAMLKARQAWPHRQGLATLLNSTELSTISETYFPFQCLHVCTRRRHFHNITGFT